jgi:hypothetical protein
LEQFNLDRLSLLSKLRNVKTLRACYQIGCSSPVFVRAWEQFSSLFPGLSQYEPAIKIELHLLHGKQSAVILHSSAVRILLLCGLSLSVILASQAGGFQYQITVI